MSYSSLIIYWLLIISSPLAFSRIYPMNQTLIILPLTTTHNLLNSSSTSFLERRRLSSSPPTKIPFTHDDFTLAASLTAGSPPQTITMVLDTGSELPWLQCKTSFFDNEKSSSYTPLPCSSPVCTTQTQDLPIPATCNDQTSLCHVAINYDDGTSVEGNLAQETFGIGSLTRPQTSFGCMDFTSSSRSPNEIGKFTGIMGMNRGRLSFVNQLGLSKFSYCISGSDSTGVLVLGDVSFPSLPPLQYTPLITKEDSLHYWDPFAYAVQFEGIRVGSKLLPIPSADLAPQRNGAGQTVLDSGTTFTFLRGPVYNILKTEFKEQTKLILTHDPSFAFGAALNLCFRVGSTQIDYSKLPTVTLMFTGAELTVLGQQLLYLVPGSGSGPDQRLCFTFGNSKLVGIEQFIIGSRHQQNVWVEYDLAQSKVGFGNDVTCDQAANQL